MTSQAMIYGAYGYTGELAVRRARQLGLAPVLGGRDAEKLAAVAERWGQGMPTRAFGLDDEAALDAALAGIGVVLHCAGPFSATSAPMAAACRRTGTHYLDITGEIGVFERLRREGAASSAAGIMTLPGIGFDVVPTDCMAARLAEELPTATHLELAFASVGGGSSQGTLKTAVENLHEGGAVRRDGAIVKVPAAHETRELDFGDGRVRLAVSIPWGDVATAFASTGIPNITCFMAASPRMVRGMKLSRPLGPLLRLGIVQRGLTRRIESGPPGPSDARRARATSYVWGAAWDADGRRVERRLRTLEGYTLTAASGLHAATRVLDGEWTAGYQTPSTAYGWRYVDGIEGTEWL
jgi:short subunit dehydrogenase-like uncharacterized protein